jgi:DNA-binding response OmpR family regulator
MARVALLCPDLLLGSKLEESLRAAGHYVTRYDGEDAARAAMPESDLLMVDLNADSFDGAVLVDSMRMGRELDGVAAVGFYMHTDQDTRRRAEQAGYDVVVPRSRIARETAAVVDGALAG